MQASMANLFGSAPLAWGLTKQGRAREPASALLNTYPFPFPPRALHKARITAMTAVPAIIPIPINAAVSIVIFSSLSECLSCAFFRMRKRVTPLDPHEFALTHRALLAVGCSSLKGRRHGPHLRRRQLGVTAREVMDDRKRLAIMRLGMDHLQFFIHSVTPRLECLSCAFWGRSLPGLLSPRGDIFCKARYR